jgi:subtilase family protein
MALAQWRQALILGALWGACMMSPGSVAADQVSDRQALVVFAAGTVSMPDTASSGELAQVMELESDLGQILTSFNVQQIERAFPEFDRADTVGVTYAEGATVRLTDWSKVWLITVPEGRSADSLIASLRTSASTIIAEPNATGMAFNAPLYPNDPYFTNGSQWGLWTPGVPQVDVKGPWGWGETTGTPTIRIGIIDGGFTGSHPDLGSRVVLTNGESLETGHAYRIAGIAGAQTNNGLGIAGIDWQAGIASRIGGVSSPERTTAEAIRFLSTNRPGFGRCRILNASWGLLDGLTPRWSALVEAAFKDHHKLDGVTVCAIGNRGMGGARDFPANFQYGMISVGAIDQSNSRWPLSSTSPTLDLVAPGVNVWSTDSIGGYVQTTGTSVAAPFVAGAAALLCAKSTVLGAEDVENILRLTADDISPANQLPCNAGLVKCTNEPPTPSDSLTGAGRLNIARALRLIESPNIALQRSFLVSGSALTFTPLTAFGPTTVFSVSDSLPDNAYSGIEPFEVTIDVPFSAIDMPTFSHPPLVWGVGSGGRTTGWIDFRGKSRLITDWRHCFATNITTSGFKLHTFVYYFPSAPYERKYFPRGPADVFLFTVTVVDVAPVPDLGNSFYVPQRGSVGTPIEGALARAFFHACPNNDGGTALANNARIKIVVKNAAGQGIEGIQANDVFILLNGGTPAQNFVGDGADSIIANLTYNSTAICPNLRVLYADAPTDVSGVTYITFAGSTPGSPGIATRDPSRKWGHFDSDLPVYVLGVPLEGRFTSTSANGSYRLQLKNYDFTYTGLGTAVDVGEMITPSETGYITNNMGATPATNPLAWWGDFDSSGSIDSADYGQLMQHYGHDCNTPNYP